MVKRLKQKGSDPQLLHFLYDKGSKIISDRNEEARNFTFSNTSQILFLSTGYVFKYCQVYNWEIPLDSGKWLVSSRFQMKHWHCWQFCWESSSQRCFRNYYIYFASLHLTQLCRHKCFSYHRYSNKFTRKRLLQILFFFVSPQFHLLCLFSSAQLNLSLTYLIVLLSIRHLNLKKKLFLQTLPTSVMPNK